MKLKVLGAVLLAIGLAGVHSTAAAQAVALATATGPGGCLTCSENTAQCPQAGYHYDLKDPSGAYKNDIGITGPYCHRADGCDVHAACGSAARIQERTDELAAASEDGEMRRLAALLVDVSWKVDRDLGGISVLSCDGKDVLLWIPLDQEQISALKTATAARLAVAVGEALVHG